jgi:hypothetical protein
MECAQAAKKSPPEEIFAPEALAKYKETYGETSSRRWRSIARSYWRSLYNEARSGFPFPRLLRAARLKGSHRTRTPSPGDNSSLADPGWPVRDDRHRGLCDESGSTFTTPNFRPQSRRIFLGERATHLLRLRGTATVEPGSRFVSSCK